MKKLFTIFVLSLLLLPLLAFAEEDEGETTKDYKFEIEEGITEGKAPLDFMRREKNKIRQSQSQVDRLRKQLAQIHEQIQRLQEKAAELQEKILDEKDSDNWRNDDKDENYEDSDEDNEDEDIEKEGDVRMRDLYRMNEGEKEFMMERRDREHKRDEFRKTETGEDRFVREIKKEQKQERKMEMMRDFTGERMYQSEEGQYRDGKGQERMRYEMKRHEKRNRKDMDKEAEGRNLDASMFSPDQIEVRERSARAQSKLMRYLKLFFNQR